MSHTRFLKMALPAIAIPSVAVPFLPFLPFLPSSFWTTYVDVVEPLSLLAGAVLALLVAFSYSKELKAAFIFLSMFLLVYALAIVLFLSYSPVLLPYLRSHLNEVGIVSLVETIQLINYAMLVFFCLNLLRAIDVTHLNKKGWILLGVTAAFSIFLATYPVLPGVKGIWTQAAPDTAHLTMRALDAALIIVLTPVLWLYIQHLKSQERQSLTFTVVISGIVFVTLFDYLFKLLAQIFPRLTPAGSLLQVAIPETLFVYGYLAIAAGLYAHLKDDAWGYEAVEKAMEGGPERGEPKEDERG